SSPASSTLSLHAALPISLPDGLTPRPYQIAGAHLIARLGSALLFDEPGTGKTITTILGLLEAHAQGRAVLPAVVVAPASVVDPWVKAFHTLAPEWQATSCRRTPKQRARLVGTADVYVASYDSARNDAQAGPLKDNPLLGVKPRTVVADEAHLMKIQQTARSKAVRRLAKGADRFIGLTGTPITHHPANLWPALDALVPGAWPSRERWVNRYCLSIPSEYGEDILGLAPAAEQEFRTTLLGQQRRVAKADV